MSTSTPLSAIEVREHLRVLYAERALADVVGLTANAEYMADLEDEIESEREAFVGAAVTEIAVLRADLSGPLAG